MIIFHTERFLVAGIGQSVARSTRHSHTMVKKVPSSRVRVKLRG